ncbi:conserved hypothetical protein [uncultured Eubacteriales bacterium]|uniref:YdhG-like domain-containing protein n=1 Tax=uncultured Eubacteriales bacterium TaxID=172733 RepID=A0A212J5V5_9FIRM|nr:conserved hypothetical protein [uncultured Eubacteriales bacterium]
MWKCPECGRAFQSADQHHFCEKYPTTIDTYIAAQPEGVQPLLNSVRDTLRAALPDAEERISWRMPTYWRGRNIIHFASFKNHLGLYPGAQAMAHFSDRLTEYNTSKGTLQLPYGRPLPLELIIEIAKWCYAENHY